MFLTESQSTTRTMNTKHAARPSDSFSAPLGNINDSKYSKQWPSTHSQTHTCTHTPSSMTLTLSLTSTQSFWSFSSEGNFTSTAIKFSFTLDRASNWECVYLVYVHRVFAGMCEHRGRPGPCNHAGLFQFVCRSQFRIYFLAHWFCFRLLSTTIVYVWVFVWGECYCLNSPFPWSHFSSLWWSLVQGCRLIAWVTFLLPDPNHYTNKAELP